MTALIGVAKPTFATIDLGGTKWGVAVGEEQIADCEFFPTPVDPHPNSLHPDSLYRTVDAIAAQVALQLGSRSLNGFGCGIAGEVSEDGNSIIRGGALQERGWVGHPIKPMLAAALGVPVEMGEMPNDAKCAGLAERRIAQRAGLLIPGFKGFVETISSGIGGAIFDIEGAVNVEPGHFDSGEEAPVVCGCNGTRCIEAWISGNSVAKAWKVQRMEHVPNEDSKWDDYLKLLYEMQLVKLDTLRAMGHDPQLWSLFGSVALGGPRRVVEDFASRLATKEPAIHVRRAPYGDKSGLQGSYFAIQDKLAQAA